MLREALTFERLSVLPAEEVAALFVARRAEGLTANESELLEAWLSQDELHRRELRRASAAWDLFDNTDDDEVLSAMRSHALARAPTTWANRRALAAAAAFVLVVGTSLLIVPNYLPGPGGNSVSPNRAVAATIEYASAVGQGRNLVLADGTSLFLDADSVVTARVGPTGRLVQLIRGRAFFNVHHDAGRPFTVRVGDRRIVDIGTQFDVNLAAGTLSVTVLEGRLAIGAADSERASVQLTAGQQLVERDGNITIRAQGVAPTGQPAWRTGLLVFDDTTLREAADEVNRYTSERIVIANPQLGAMRVSGQFRAGQSNRFAQTVAEIHPVKVIRNGEEIELVPTR